MAEIDKMHVGIYADPTKMKQGLDQAKGQLQSFGSQVKKIAGMLGLAFGTAQIISFVKSSKQAYDIQVQSETRLLTALKGREDVYRRLTQQARELQQVTLFGDEETIQAQALLASLGLTEKQIRDLIPLIQDMSVAMGIDFKSAASLVGKTVSTSTDALARYFETGLDGVIKQSERAAILTRALSDNFAGQAKAAREADTGTGALANTWGDLKETLVEVVVQTSSLRDNLNSLDRIITYINNAEKLTKIAEGWRQIHDVIKYLNPVLGIVRVQFEAISGVVKLFEKKFKKSGFPELAKGAEEAAKWAKEWAEQTGYLTSKKNEEIKTLKTLKSDLEELQADLENTNIKDREGIVVIQQKIAALEKEIETIENLSASLARPEIKEIDFDIGGLPGELPEVGEAFSEQFSDMTNEMAMNLKNAEYLLGQFFEDYREEITQTISMQEMFADSLRNTGQMAAYAFGEAMGDLVDNTKSWSDSIGQMIANIAKQLGRKLIAIGSGMMLIPGQQAKGLGMIAKGTALVAIGQMASNVNNPSFRENEVSNQVMKSAESNQLPRRNEPLTVYKIDNRYIYLASRRGAVHTEAIT